LKGEIVAVARAAKAAAEATRKAQYAVELITRLPGLHSQSSVPHIVPSEIAEKSSTEMAQAEILRRAIEVIGSEDEAMRWMGTPVQALDYATPISMLYDKRGFEAVRTVLGRLEHGVL